MTSHQMDKSVQQHLIDLEKDDALKIGSTPAKEAYPYELKTILQYNFQWATGKRISLYNMRNIRNLFVVQ